MYKNASNHPTCWDHGLYGHFCTEPCTKNAGESLIFLWITAREQKVCIKPTTCNPNQNRAAPWRIFLTNLSATVIGRKDSIQTVIPTSRRLDFFLYEAASAVFILSKICSCLPVTLLCSGQSLRGEEYSCWSQPRGRNLPSEFTWSYVLDFFSSVQGSLHC